MGGVAGKCLPSKQRETGSNMPKGSEERTNARKEEIIHACARLYETMSFKEITIKEIGQATSFTRTSIYNYFRTKEEIFLALFQREYALWTEEMKRICSAYPVLSKQEFARALAHSLEERETLLKLLSMNLYDMEENSRMDRLVEFKSVYGRAIEQLENCLKQFFPAMNEQDRSKFVFSFLPFMFGIYPYAVVTPKQKEAMEQAGVNYLYLSIYDLIYMQVSKLLGEE